MRNAVLWTYLISQPQVLGQLRNLHETAEKGSDNSGLFPLGTNPALLPMDRSSCAHGAKSSEFRNPLVVGLGWGRALFPLVSQLSRCRN